METKLICPICKCNFEPQEAGQEKCSRCGREHPNEHSIEEVIAKDNPAREQHQRLTEDRVKILIYEVLSEAEINRESCETCKKLFFKRSPAQRRCRACIEKDKV